MQLAAPMKETRRLSQPVCCFQTDAGPPPPALTSPVTVVDGYTSQPSDSWDDGANRLNELKLSCCCLLVFFFFLALLSLLAKTAFASGYWWQVCLLWLSCCQCLGGIFTLFFVETISDLFVVGKFSHKGILLFFVSPVSTPFEQVS